MTLPHAVLVDCLGQWVFNRGEVAPGEFYLQVVVSASGELKALGREEIERRIVGRTGAAVPASRPAKLLRVEGGDGARRDVQRGAGRGSVAAAAGVAGREPGRRRRLDRDRLARDDGRRGPQRLPRGRGDPGPRGPARTNPAARPRLIPYLLVVVNSRSRSS